MFCFEVAGIGVNAVFSIDPVMMVFGEPLRAIGLTAFFVSRERQDEVTRGDPTPLYQPHKIRSQDRVALYDVGRAAAIKKTIHLIQLEWVHGPVLAQRFYNVEVGDKQDGLAGAASAQTDDKVFLLRLWPIDVNIFCGKARSAKASSHSFCRGSHVAGRCVSSIDFNELLKNIASSLMFRCERGLRLGEGEAAQQSHGASQSQKAFNHRAWIINSG
jgi:hypothetical protein